MRQLPGVAAAGVGGSPMGMLIGLGGVKMPGDPRQFGMVGVAPVGPGYFEALGARLIEGRFFSPHDREGAPTVAVLSTSTAHRFWPEGSPIGRTLFPDGDTNRVVGVVADMAEWGLETKGGGVFLPSTQSVYFGWERMLIRMDT